MRFDRRHFKWWWQRRTRGFDDRELWSLDFTIIEFTYPRLKAFRKGGTLGYPPNLSGCAEWEAILDKMIRAMEIWIEDDGLPLEKDKHQEMEEGLDLFHDYFHHLWD